MTPGSTKEAELTFGDGARALFGGVRYVMGSPSVWPLAIVPVLMCIATVTACTWAGYSFGADALAPHLPTGGVTGSVLKALADVLLFVLCLIVGLVVGLSLAQPLSAPALDALAKRRARALGVSNFTESGPAASVFRSLRVVSLALLVGLPILLALSLITLLVPPAAALTLPAKFLVASWLATWDVFDYAFGLGALGVRERLAWLSRHGMAAFAFGLALAAVALIPGLGLFVLPMGVAGATELWAKTQARGP